MPDTKKCKTCKQTLPLSMFHARRESPDGLQYICKACKQKAMLRHAIALEALREKAPPPGFKRCKTCKVCKSIEDFARRNASPDGRQYICKECMGKIQTPDCHILQADKDECFRLVREYPADFRGYYTWTQILDACPKCDICGLRYPARFFETRDGVRATACAKCNIQT